MAEKKVRVYVADGVIHDGKQQYKPSDPLDLPKSQAEQLMTAGIVTDRQPNTEPETELTVGGEGEGNPGTDE